jgi:vacuolar-type H+-ATPase subunit E/Vma4
MTEKKLQAREQQAEVQKRYQKELTRYHQQIKKSQKKADPTKAA